MIAWAVSDGKVARVVAAYGVRPRLYRHGAALLIFVVAAVVWLAPMALHPRTHLLRGFSDSTAQIRDYWAAENQGETPFTMTGDQLNGAPEGRPLSPAIQSANAFQPGFVWMSKGIFGLIGAWNVFLLLGFVGTAIAAFSLLDRLGCTFLPSLFGGYVFAFNPWAIERALAGHIAFLHGWIFVVLIAALMRSRRRERARRRSLRRSASSARRRRSRGRGERAPEPARVTPRCCRRSAPSRVRRRPPQHSKRRSLRSSDCMEGPVRRGRSLSASVVKVWGDVDAGEAVGCVGWVVGSDRAVVAAAGAAFSLSGPQAVR